MGGDAIVNFSSSRLEFEAGTLIAPLMDWDGVVKRSCYGCFFPFHMFVIRCFLWVAK